MTEREENALFGLRCAEDEEAEEREEREDRRARNFWLALGAAVYLLAVAGGVCAVWRMM